MDSNANSAVPKLIPVGSGLFCPVLLCSISKCIKFTEGKGQEIEITLCCHSNELFFLFLPPFSSTRLFSPLSPPFTLLFCFFEFSTILASLTPSSTSYIPYHCTFEQSAECRVQQSVKYYDDILTTSLLPHPSDIGSLSILMVFFPHEYTLLSSILCILLFVMCL